MLGSLDIFPSRNALLKEHPGTVVRGLGEFNFGQRSAASIFRVGEGFEIVGLSLIDVCRFKVRQLLALLHNAALAGIETHEPAFMYGANVCHAVFRNKNLTGGEYCPGDRL